MKNDPEPEGELGIFLNNEMEMIRLSEKSMKNMDFFRQPFHAFKLEIVEILDYLD